MKSKSFKIVSLVVVLLAMVVLGVFLAIGYFRPLKAGIIIETNPSSLVFINNEQVGRARYEGTREAGEVVVKLVPESFDQPLPPYEVRLDLVAGVKTIIERDFGATEETSSAAIISFEKISSRETGLAIVSTPDASQIAIDGQVRNLTPYKTTNITPGEHVISLSAPGYFEKTVKAKTYQGYKLTAVFKLAQGQSQPATPFPSPTPSGEKERFQVEILTTPTGFLRVRNEPSTLAREIGQVEPGKRYLFVEEDTKTGWFKIEFTPGKEGWVSNQYAKKVGSVATPTPKVSPTPSVKASPTSTPKVSPTPK